jgi:zinc transport system substrate-binding protein
MFQTHGCSGSYHSAFLRGITPSVVFLIAVIVLLNACQQPPRPRSEHLQVVASIYPVADWARQIGGNKVEVYTLLPAGVSPHTFEPTPNEVRELAQADIFFKIGLGLESWAEKLVEATSGSHLRVVTLADNLKVPFTTGGLTIHFPEHYEAGAQSEHHHLATDPHVWLDPVLAQDMVTVIARTLVDVDPTNVQYYEMRLTDYGAQLRTLDEEIRRTVSGFTSRELVTVHSMLHYFALRYGLHEAAVIEASPGKVPSPADVNRVIKLLRTMDRPVIFIEPQLSDKAARVIANEAGAAVEVLDPLGNPDTPDRNTYIKLMQYNLKTLERYMK